jgi:hypothetical protein
MRLATEVTNIPTGKRYYVSTTEVQAVGNRVWQTAVFRKRFGPFAGMFKPVLFVGGVDESLSRLQHERVESIVRNTAPSDWESAKWGLLSELSEMQAQSESSEDRTFYEHLLRMTGGGN